MLGRWAVLIYDSPWVYGSTLTTRAFFLSPRTSGLGYALEMRRRILYVSRAFLDSRHSHFGMFSSRWLLLFLVRTSLLFSTFRSTFALRIEPPLPSTVTALQPVTFTWIREPKDPERFAFQKLPINGDGPSEPFDVRGPEGQSGEFTLTFTRLL